jgi:formylmethanofuran dehydrogenase subunit E
MSWWWTEDPAADFARHDREQARRLAKLPTCDRCGYPIQQEMAVRIYGKWFCDECITECREELVIE